MSARQIRIDIQVYRAIAVLLVIFSHLPEPLQLRGGFVGVDIFFVISGYVVTRIVREIPADVTSYSRFLTRRISRLFPALLLVNGSVLAGILLITPANAAKDFFLAGLSGNFMAANLYFLKYFGDYWNPFARFSPFLHEWSLGVEFQVYLLLPFLVWTTRKNIATWLRYLTFLISFILFCVFILLGVETLWGVSASGLAFFSPMSRLWEFFLGAAAASTWIPSRYHRWLLWSAFPAIGFGIISAQVIGGLNFGVLSLDLGFALLLTQNYSPKFNGKVSTFLQWLGDRSYSLYLWHWPLIVFAAELSPYPQLPLSLLAVGVSFALAHATFLKVETKFRKTLNAPFWRSNIRWASIALILSLLCGLLFSAADSKAIRTPAFARGSSVNLTETVSDRTFLKAMDACSFEAQVATCMNSKSGSYAVVLGDSLAYRSLPAVQYLAEHRSINVKLFWSSGCGFTYGTCNSEAYRFLSRHKVAFVFTAMNFALPATVANGDESMQNLAPECRSPNAGKCTSREQALRGLYFAGIRGINQLNRYTQHIIISSYFPQQSPKSWRCLNRSFLATAVGDQKPCLPTTRAWEEVRSRGLDSVVKRLETRKEQVKIFYPMQSLCTQNFCPAVTRSGERIFDDSVHWTWAASRFFLRNLGNFDFRG